MQKLAFILTLGGLLSVATHGTPCNRALDFGAEISLATPYQSDQDVIAAGRALKVRVQQESKGRLSPQQVSEVSARLLSSSFHAVRDVSPEFLIQFIDKRLHGSWPADVRYRLLELHLAADRPQTLEGINESYRELLRLRSSGANIDFPEALMILQLTWVDGLDKQTIFLPNHHHPIGGQLLGVANYRDRLYVIRALARHSGRLPTRAEVNEVLARADQLGQEFGEFPESPDHDVRLVRDSFLSVLRSIYFKRPAEDRGTIRNLKRKIKELVYQATDFKVERLELGALEFGLLSESIQLR